MQIVELTCNWECPQKQENSASCLPLPRLPVFTRPLPRQMANMFVGDNIKGKNFKMSYFTSHSIFTKRENFYINRPSLKTKQNEKRMQRATRGARGRGERPRRRLAAQNITNVTYSKSTMKPEEGARGPAAARPRAGREPHA